MEEVEHFTWVLGDPKASLDSKLDLVVVQFGGERGTSAKEGKEEDCFGPSALHWMVSQLIKAESNEASLTVVQDKRYWSTLKGVLDGVDEGAVASVVPPSSLRSLPHVLQSKLPEGCYTQIAQCVRGLARISPAVVQSFDVVAGIVSACTKAMRIGDDVERKGALALLTSTIRLATAAFQQQDLSKKTFSTFADTLVIPLCRAASHLQWASDEQNSQLQSAVEKLFLHTIFGESSLDAYQLAFTATTMTEKEDSGKGTGKKERKQYKGKGLVSYQRSLFKAIDLFLTEANKDYGDSGLFEPGIAMILRAYVTALKRGDRQMLAGEGQAGQEAARANTKNSGHNNSLAFAFFYELLHKGCKGSSAGVSTLAVSSVHSCCREIVLQGLHKTTAVISAKPVFRRLRDSVLAALEEDVVNKEGGKEGQRARAATCLNAMASIIDVEHSVVEERLDDYVRLAVICESKWGSESPVNGAVSSFCTTLVRTFYRVRHLQQLAQSAVRVARALSSTAEGRCKVMQWPAVLLREVAAAVSQTPVAQVLLVFDSVCEYFSSDCAEPDWKATGLVIALLSRIASATSFTEVAHARALLAHMDKLWMFAKTHAASNGGGKAEKRKRQSLSEYDALSMCALADVVRVAERMTEKCVTELRQDEDSFANASPSATLAHIDRFPAEVLAFVEVAPIHSGGEEGGNPALVFLSAAAQLDILLDRKQKVWHALRRLQLEIIRVVHDRDEGEVERKRVARDELDGVISKVQAVYASVAQASSSVLSSVIGRLSQGPTGEEERKGKKKKSVHNGQNEREGSSLLQLGLKAMESATSAKGMMLVDDAAVALLQKGERGAGGAVACLMRVLALHSHALLKDCDTELLSTCTTLFSSAFAVCTDAPLSRTFSSSLDNVARARSEAGVTVSTAVQRSFSAIMEAVNGSSERASKIEGSGRVAHCLSLLVTSVSERHDEREMEVLCSLLTPTFWGKQEGAEERKVGWELAFVWFAVVSKWRSPSLKLLHLAVDVMIGLTSQLDQALQEGKGEGEAARLLDSFKKVISAACEARLLEVVDRCVETCIQHTLTHPHFASSLGWRLVAAIGWYERGEYISMGEAPVLPLSSSLHESAVLKQMWSGRDEEGDAMGAKAVAIAVDVEISRERVESAIVEVANAIKREAKTNDSEGLCAGLALAGACLRRLRHDAHIARDGVAQLLEALLYVGSEWVEENEVGWVELALPPYSLFLMGFPLAQSDTSDPHYAEGVVAVEQYKTTSKAAMWFLTLSQLQHLPAGYASLSSTQLATAIDLHPSACTPINVVGAAALMATIITSEASDAEWSAGWAGGLPSLLSLCQLHASSEVKNEKQHSVLSCLLSLLTASVAAKARALSRRNGSGVFSSVFHLLSTLLSLNKVEGGSSSILSLLSLLRAHFCARSVSSLLQTSTTSVLVNATSFTIALKLTLDSLASLRQEAEEGTLGCELVRLDGGLQVVDSRSREVSLRRFAYFVTSLRRPFEELRQHKGAVSKYVPRILRSLLTVMEVFAEDGMVVGTNRSQPSSLTSLQLQTRDGRLSSLREEVYDDLTLCGCALIASTTKYELSHAYVNLTSAGQALLRRLNEVYNDNYRYKGKA